MSTYVLINWLFCVTTSLILGIAIWRDRSLLIKPSIIIVLFFHLMVQWAATVDAPSIETYLPYPWSFILLAQAFPLIGLIVSLNIRRHLSRSIWKRVQQPAYSYGNYRLKAIVVLGGYFFFFLPVYFSQVPFTTTGFYTIINDPANATMAREYSLKLLNSPLIKYGYVFMSSVFGPLMAIFLCRALIESLKRKRFLISIFSLVGMMGVLIAVSLTGARANAANIILAVLFAEWIRRGAPINLPFIILAALAILTIPTLITMFRQGNEISFGAFWIFLTTGIFWRVFYLPMGTGLMFVHFAQTSGTIGIQAIPRLALLFGLQPIDAPNMIALLYTSTGIESTIANTSNIFAYYAYFGIISLPLSLLALWSLDLALLVYRRIGDGMLLACVACVSVAGIALVSTEYTIVLLSHGYLLLLFVAWAIDRINRPKHTLPIRSTSLKNGINRVGIR